MITRERALELLAERGVREGLLRHSLASEAVLRALARRLGGDEELWGLAGLLHDLDYPATEARPELHGLEGAKALEGLLPEEALHAIRAHNGELNGTVVESLLDKALRSGESVTGLVSAAALVRPGGMEGMQPKSLKKKLKDKAFAAGVSREAVRACEHMGLSLDEFLALAIEAMAARAGELGLARA